MEEKGILGLSVTLFHDCTNLVVPEKEFEFSAKEDNTAENEWICPVCKESNSQHQISCKKCFAEKSVEDVRRCRFALCPFNFPAFLPRQE